MKGRTNISGGQLTLNATTEEFQVADGQSITAGNFVQYEMKENMEKYDENSIEKIAGRDKKAVGQ